MTKIHKFSDYCNVKQDGVDSTPSVLRFLSHISQKEQGDVFCLSFEPRDYHFYPEFAAQRYLSISNNDPGMKRTIFPFEGIDCLRIEGNGARFIFHGKVIPFSLKDCSLIALSDFSIDYAEPMFVQGTITGSTHEYVDLEIDEAEYPFEIVNRRFFYKTPYYTTDRIHNFLEMDARYHRPAEGAGDEGWECSAQAERLDNGSIRFHRPFERLHKLGNVMVMTIQNRECPAIVLDRCERISLDGVSIFHACSMGLIAQCSDSIQMTNCRVCLPPDSRRLMSAAADATHFVNCTGKIVINKCRFENQNDDAVNCHGIYTTVFAIQENAVFVQLRHPQQYGINVYRVGDRVTFIDRSSMRPVTSAVVRDSTLVNEQLIRLSLEQLPEGTSLGQAVENAGRMPSLSVTDCSIGNNRARGILVTTPGDIMISGNDFYTAGASILVEGDANLWYESGGGVELCVERNNFVGCGYSPWGEAIIQFSPGVDRAEPEFDYHRALKARGNRFIGCKLELTRTTQVREVVFEDNIIERECANEQ